MCRYSQGLILLIVPLLYRIRQKIRPYIGIHKDYSLLPLVKYNYIRLYVGIHKDYFSLLSLVIQNYIDFPYVGACRGYCFLVTQNYINHPICRSLQRLLLLSCYTELHRTSSYMQGTVGVIAYALLYRITQYQHICRELLGLS